MARVALPERGDHLSVVGDTYVLSHIRHGEPKAGETVVVEVDFDLVLAQLVVAIDIPDAVDGGEVGFDLFGEGAPLIVSVDIDPKKIGRTRRGLPIVSPVELPEWLGRFQRAAVLASVGSRGARDLIRGQLKELGLEEGVDWWAVA